MFKVEYWSEFHGEWKEYVAPTWNAKAIRHATGEEAQERRDRIARGWPYDKFRVTMLDQAKP